MPLIETAIFPSAIATATDLLNWKNVVPSGSAPTLNAAINNAVTTIVLTAGTGASLPADNFVVSIDDEIIFVSSRSTDTLTCTRGYEGTTGASHLISAPVYQRVTAKSHNQLASEVNAIETQLGVNLSAVKAAFQNQSYSYVVDTGAADAYVATLSPAVTAYTTGQRFCFKAVNANLTTTPTLNVNGLGAKTITKNAGAALAASDIKAGQVVDVEYDGTNFQIQSTLGNAPSGTGTVTHTAGSLTSGQLVFGNGTADITVGNLSGDVTTAGGAATLVKGMHWTQTSVVFAGSPYAVLATDTEINCNATGGNVVLNLPASSGDGKNYFFIKTDASTNTCTISRNAVPGTDTIEGSTSVVLSSTYDSLYLTDASSGSWLKISPKTPGSAGNIFFNNAGSFGAVAGTSSDNLTDVSGGPSNPISISRTYTVGHTTNAIHAIDTQITYTGAAKENTISGGAYSRTMWQGTGGGGHIGVFFARSYDNGTNATAVDTFDNYYSDFNFFGSATATNPVTQATHFHAVNGISQGGSAANVYANFAGFRYENQTWTSPTTATIEQAFVAGMPAVNNAQLATFYGLRTGGCIAGSKYSALCIDGGTSYFKQPVDISGMTYAAAPATPMTNGGLNGINMSNFVSSNVTGIQFKSLMTAGNGIASGTMIGFDSTIDNGGSGTLGSGVAFRAKVSSSGGVTITKGIGFQVLAATNSATTTDITGVEIGSQTSGTNTNTPRAIDQLGASDINVYAGLSFLNANRTFVASDFTTAANTNLQNITGLSFVLPKNIAVNTPFTCSLLYSQATATAAVSFGISASVAPTQINAKGAMYTSTTASTAGNITGLASTTATAIVTATPSAITTVWNADLSGFIENPSGAASTITIMVKTATSGDAVTIKRGSYCTLGS